MTATPFRRDHLDELMFHQLGQVEHTMGPQNPAQLPREQGDIPAPELSLEVHPTSFAYSEDADPAKPGGISRIYGDLVSDEERLQQIVDDVLAAYRPQAKILLLTTSRIPDLEMLDDVLSLNWPYYSAAASIKRFNESTSRPLPQNSGYSSRRSSTSRMALLRLLGNPLGQIDIFLPRLERKRHQIGDGYRPGAGPGLRCRSRSAAGRSRYDCRTR